MPKASAAPPVPSLNRSLVLLLAVATGLVVANLYYIQPLLDDVAREFSVGARTAGALVTTVYLTTYFIGGALGSALSASAFSAFGWLGVALAGGLCGLGIVLVWLLAAARARA